MITHQDNGLRSIVMSKTIITVQHTESEHHLNGHAGAWGNWPLTKKGHQQAFEIGKWLLTEGCDDGYIMYCSVKFRFECEAFIKIYNLPFPEDWDVDEDYRFDISPVMI